MSLETYGKLTDDVELTLEVADSQAKSTSERLTHKQVFSKLSETVNAKVETQVSSVVLQKCERN